MVTLPGAPEAARPWLPAAFDTLATAALELDQVTCAVRSWTVASEYRPVAVYWTEIPVAMVASAGVTSIESNVAPVTVRPVEPVLPPKEAVTVTVPSTTAVARPWLPAAFDTPATE